MAPPSHHPRHDEVEGLQGGWIISKIPENVTEQNIIDTIAVEFRFASERATTSYAASASSVGSSSESLLPTVHVDLRHNCIDPPSSYAFVTPSYLKNDAADRPSWTDSLEQVLFTHGIVTNGTTCKVKKRRPPKRERVANNERRKRKKLQAAERAMAERPKWQPKMFGRFASRGNSMDPHVFMADLNAELLHLVEEVYLPCIFPASCRNEIIAALKHVWTKNPKSLRVKEIFETLEAFKLIEQQLSQLMASSKKRGDAPISTIYDLACGHGLLGVMLAYRFASVRIVCVDLERRKCFDHYLEAFRKFGKAAQGETLALSNLFFEEKDFTTLAADEVGPNSFFTMIHGCNEATKLAIELAQRHGAGYAAMPCCVRDGLYCVNRVAQVDDATRHTVMVGMLAGIYKAHSITAINIRITNRNLILFGGYTIDDKLSKRTE